MVQAETKPDWQLTTSLRTFRLCGTGKPVRNILAILFMVVGPLAVWLVYAHFFRDFGAQREWREAVLIGIAMVAGSMGALALGSPFNRWPLSAKLCGFVIYGAGLSFAMPPISTPS